MPIDTTRKLSGKGIFEPVTKAIPGRSKSGLSDQQAKMMIAQAKNLKNDDDKYQVAVDAARMKLNTGDGREPSEQEFKDTIDSYLDQIGTEKSGREMRGDNIFTDVVSGMRQGIEGFNEGIGNGLDAAGDFLIGDVLLGNLANKETADRFKNLVTGKELAVVPDIAEDIALAATGVGIPVLAAKGAIQMSPYLDQGITGRDSVTNEKMDIGQQAANLGLGIFGTALSAVPGIGKARNILTTAKDAEKTAKILSNEKAIEKAIPNQEKELIEALDATKATNRRALLDTPEVSPYKQEKEIKEALEAINATNKRSGLSAVNPSEEEMKQVVSKTNKNPEEALSSEEVREAIRQNLADQEKDAVAAMSTPGRVARLLAADARGLGSGLVQSPRTFANAMSSLFGEGKQASGKKLAKKVNKAFDTGSPQTLKHNGGAIDVAVQEGETPAQAFARIVQDTYKADNSFDNLTPEQMAQAAEAFGLKSLDEIPARELTGMFSGLPRNMRRTWHGQEWIPSQRGSIRKEAREAIDNAIDEKKAADKSFKAKHNEKMEARNTAEEVLTQDMIDANLLNPQLIGGYGPLSRFRQAAAAPLEDIGRRANVAATDFGTVEQARFRKVLDGLMKKGEGATASGIKKEAAEEAAENAEKNAVKDMADEALEGSKGKTVLDRAARHGGDIKDAARPYASRAFDMGIGLAANPVMLPLSYMAETGSSWGEAIDALTEQIENGDIPIGAIMAPMLTGSKGASRKLIPGPSRYTGGLSLPHTAMRAQSALNYGSDEFGANTENEGYQQALNRIAQLKREEK